MLYTTDNFEGGSKCKKPLPRSSLFKQSHLSGNNDVISEEIKPLLDYLTPEEQKSKRKVRDRKHSELEHVQKNDEEFSETLKGFPGRENNIMNDSTDQRVPCVIPSHSSASSQPSTLTKCSNLSCLSSEEEVNFTPSINWLNQQTNGSTQPQRKRQRPVASRRSNGPPPVMVRIPKCRDSIASNFSIGSAKSLLDVRQCYFNPDASLTSMIIRDYSDVYPKGTWALINESFDYIPLMRNYDYSSVPTLATIDEIDKVDRDYTKMSKHDMSNIASDDDFKPAFTSSTNRDLCESLESIVDLDEVRGIPCCPKYLCFCRLPHIVLIVSIVSMVMSFIMMVLLCFTQHWLSSLGTFGDSLKDDYFYHMLMILYFGIIFFFLWFVASVLLAFAAIKWKRKLSITWLAVTSVVIIFCFIWIIFVLYSLQIWEAIISYEYVLTDVILCLLLLFPLILFFCIVLYFVHSMQPMACLKHLKQRKFNRKEEGNIIIRSGFKETKERMKDNDDVLSQDFSTFQDKDAKKKTINWQKSPNSHSSITNLDQIELPIIYPNNQSPRSNQRNSLNYKQNRNTIHSISNYSINEVKNQNNEVINVKNQDIKAMHKKAPYHFSHQMNESFDSSGQSTDSQFQLRYNEQHTPRSPSRIRDHTNETEESLSHQKRKEYSHPTENNVLSTLESERSLNNHPVAKQRNSLDSSSSNMSTSSLRPASSYINSSLGKITNRNDIDTSTYSSIVSKEDARPQGDPRRVTVGCIHEPSLTLGYLACGASNMVSKCQHCHSFETEPHQGRLQGSETTGSLSAYSSVNSLTSFAGNRSRRLGTITEGKRS